MNVSIRLQIFIEPLLLLTKSGFKKKQVGSLGKTKMSKAAQWYTVQECDARMMQ